MQYFNPKIECASVEELRKIQSTRLASMVRRCCENVPLYKKKLSEAGITPADITSIDDISKLPFTYKQDFRDEYPFGMFAVPREEIVRIHASSGTTGKQTVVGYTKNDIAAWSEDAARALAAAGATPSDIVQVAYGYGLFTGGLGLHYGVERLGAAVVPASSGNTARQVDLLRDFGTNILCCTPSYAMYIGETLREKGIDPSSLPLRAGIFGAEPWTEEMRREIEKILGIKAFDIYGLSEVVGPGVAFECECQSGLHVNEDKYYPEIIDPETGATLPDGAYGELVFSCIAKEALPLIRYRTRDIAMLTRGTCSCGRSLVRMSKPHGRTDDMLIIRGVNVFPSQIESVLMELGGSIPSYQLIVDRVNNTDRLEVQVELLPEMFSDEIKVLEATEQRIKAGLSHVLGLSATVRLVEHGSIPRSEGKAKRVVDRRQ